MEIPPALLALLRCPQTRQRLTVAPAELVKKLEAQRVAGTLLGGAGKRIAYPICGGVCREDGAVFYPSRDGIPVLLIEEAIALR